MSDPRQEYDLAINGLLRRSTLVPGILRPSLDLRGIDHAAVIVGGIPVLLCGPAADENSIIQAEALAASGLLHKACAGAGYAGGIGTRRIRGIDIEWSDTETAIIGKPSGAGGSRDGGIMAIVLNDPDRVLAFYLCLTTETARAIDPGCPALDDGALLPRLARRLLGYTPHLH